MTLLWRLFSEERPDPKTYFLVAKAGGPQGEWIPCLISPEGLVQSRYVVCFVDTDKWTHWAYVTTPSAQLKPKPVRVDTVEWWPVTGDEPEGTPSVVIEKDGKFQMCCAKTVKSEKPA